MAGPVPVFLDIRSFISARPDFAADAPRLASRLDGMPCTSATVFLGRSRFGFFLPSAASTPATMAAPASFLTADIRRPWGLAVVLAEDGFALAAERGLALGASFLAGFTVRLAADFLVAFLADFFAPLRAAAFDTVFFLACFF